MTVIQSPNRASVTSSTSSPTPPNNESPTPPNQQSANSSSVSQPTPLQPPAAVPPTVNDVSSSPSDVSSATPPTEKANDVGVSSSLLSSGDAPSPTLTATSGPLPEEEPPPPSPQALLESFPVTKLNKLEELISNPRWVIPVLPKAELEMLLETSIVLARHGVDRESEPCQRFFREGLVISFTKIMTDEAVSSWRLDIHKCILKNCERLIELCVLKLLDDWFPLLDLLALVLNPGNKFHLYNAPRPAEATFPGPSQPYAVSADARTPRGWLVDLLNRFGHLGGFDKLLQRFKSDKELTVPLIHVLVKPFGQCYDLLSHHTVSNYLLRVVEIVPSFLESLSDDDLKKETKNESKNDALSTIIKSLKNIASAVPGQEENIRQLEMFRLKMILRQLQVSSFGGKMNALNEVNRVITSVSYYPQRHPNPSEEEDFLTAERMAAWLKENRVLQIVLQDSLHQPQYVEKLEKVIRFIIKEKTLSLGDLDDIWAAQVGQHEAIVKNVHDLLAKLAWDFSPEQLDHLFECFQTSWNNATPKQREKLLELIRRLAEDDKDGVMAEKVLTLFWSLAHNPDTSIELLDQALAAHVKILDYSCTQYRESQKNRWLEKCIDELKGNKKWVIPALKQIREICCLYQENPQNTNHGQRTQAVQYRHEIINKLQSNHALVILVADNLTAYIEEVRKCPKKTLDADPADIYPDGRFNHITQVQERLSFLRFLLKDGQLWLCAPQAKQIWNCLAENAVFTQDREACFKWFSKLMGEEPDLDPEINRDFFENNILQLEPSLMTESGIKCFDRFFKAVNSKENKLIPKRRAFLMDDLELIGLDYIWRLVLCSHDDIANRAIDLLKDTFTNLGPRLQSSQVDIHEDFISSCMDRLKASYDTITVIEQDKDNKLQQELTRLCRVLRVLHEYVMECDAGFGEERTLIPLYRACRGTQIMLSIRFPNQGRQIDDLEIWTHSNDTLGSLRRQVIQRLKITAVNVKLELYLNGDLVDTADDQKTLGVLPLKDKTLLTGKLSQAGGNLVSSPDSSSDSSTSSPRHHYDGPNVEVEQCLPGVIMSNQKTYGQFLLQLADLGSSQGHLPLQEGSRALLKLIPSDKHTIDRLRSTCLEFQASKKSHTQIWENIFFNSSPSQTLYNLEVCYSLLMPASGSLADATIEFQLAFVRAKGISAIIGMLTRNNFLSKADLATKRAAFLTLLKMCKLLFTVAGYSMVHMVAEACQPDSTTSVSPSVHNQAVVLQQALIQIPNPGQEMIVRNIAQRLATSLMDVGATYMPDQATVGAIIRLVWASAGANLALTNSTVEELHARFKENVTPEGEEVALCREGIEVLTLAMALYPQCLESLCKDKSWQNFIIDLVLLSPVKGIRQGAAEQFICIATRCSPEQQPLRYFTTLLFTVLNSTVPEKAEQSSDYFFLLSRLLAFASTSGYPLNTAETLLNNEIAWLKKVRENVRQFGTTGCAESLLEGHIFICRDLLAFMSAEKKFEVGSSNKSAINLVRDLLDDFLFPSSRMMVINRQTNEIPLNQALPVCTTGSTVMAAFDLLVGLCTGCAPNLKLVAHILMEMFYTDKDDVLQEWEYLPPIGPRPNNGFVGLKNAGATCYMNSVLQQLFMIEGIREGVLSAEGACTNVDEDFSGEDKEDDLNDNDVPDDEQNRKEYNITILKQVQAIFAHLAKTKLQFYVPKGLWKHFRMMQGEPVNLREQQDAVEFFMRLIDLADEALKELGHEQKMTKILGGIFSDQKICKTCPHRYSREQPFSVISVDIKNYSNLTDSLHEYVKGELLDGSNAYYCERCDKKVDTIKRLCVKKLPPILVIQLKRFDYDYERECAIKFNDYFEFPRELDMEPYTVAGLAKIEGEALDCDPSDLDGKVVRNYHLRGMVVHSGQASGGHYYSYIKCKGPDNQHSWYKFDDGDVSEIKMEEDEELKNQCYGGEYMSEVFDPMLKRLSYRKQKRWWNAYMLFYTRADVDEAALSAKMENMNLTADSAKVQKSSLKVPLPIEKSIQKQNISFMHHRNQYSLEYFSFMRKIINCNVPFVTPQSNQSERITPEGEELAMLTIQLASKFLFTSGFRTKKTLRGPAQEWYEILTQHLRYSRQVRLWFCQKVLFAHPVRFCEYILECPSAEVRTSFVRIIVFIAHFSLNDGPCPVPSILQQSVGNGGAVEPPPPGLTLSDHLLQTVLMLLWMEVSEHGRHLPQYFTLFVMYASLGVAEKTQLLKLTVPAIFIQVALDEGPGPPIKYQYAELAKLYQVVSQLVRCCDVSGKCQSAVEGKAVLPNPYVEPSCPNGKPLQLIQPQVQEMIFQRFGYLKKLIEEANASEDTRKLLQFCSWENPSFSHAVLHELLWQIAIAYTHELRPYLDLLLHILSMEDSWQSLRIQKSLRGIPDDHNAREGIFDTIQRSKTHYQKRAYQCIKLLVTLFSQCPAAKHLLDNNSDIKRKWSWSVEWLSDELERGRGGTSYNPATSGQYSYNNWSPPAQSNESVNGYFLERSHSARLTLEKACELLPDEEIEAEVVPDIAATDPNATRSVGFAAAGGIQEAREDPPRPTTATASDGSTENTGSNRTDEEKPQAKLDGQPLKDNKDL